MWRSKYNQEQLETVLSNCKTIIVYDLETSGLSKTEDRIIQFSGIKYTITDEKKLKIADQKNIYIYPGFAISEKIEQLTGITDDYLVEHGMQEEKAFEEIYDFMDSECVSGYNNRTFDDKFMEVLYNRYNKVFNPTYSLDVLAMAKDLVDKKNTENYKLATIAHIYGLDKDITFHSSDNDAYVTGMLLQVFIHAYESEQREEESSKPEAKILSITYWEGQRHTMKRIYVNTNYGSLYFDSYYKTWEEKDKGLFSRINMEKLQQKVMEKIGVDSLDELAKFKGRIA